jgi:hypothetical protein
MHTIRSAAAIAPRVAESGWVPVLTPPSAHQSQQYSTQIFSLAVMLSSMFVYNQMGGESAECTRSAIVVVTMHVA